MYIFLSHSSENHAVAEELCLLLEREGHGCFLAPRDIRSGHEYAEEILDGIERSDVMLLLLSEAANNSPHVLREVERAVSKKIQIVVYQLEQVKLSKSMEYFLMSHQWVNTAPDTEYESILTCMEELAAGGQQIYMQQEAEPEKTNRTGSFMKSLRKHSGLLLALILFVLVAALVLYLLQTGNEGDGLEADVQSEQEEISMSRPSPTMAPKMELGDTILLGTYQGEPIEWRVLKLHEDGTAVVVSSHILTMKAFDAAESGRYNSSDGISYWTESARELEAELQCKLRGSSRWSTSNIRTWLNSEKENVSYADQAPKSTAMSELVNGYDMEAGFLSDFSEAERNAICTTKVTTGNEVSEDKVFLLSKDELVWFEEADVSRIAIPTETAIAKDLTGWYGLFALDYGVTDYYWWLRDAVVTEEGFSAYEAYIVANSYAEGTLIGKSVGLEGFGIRPAMTVDLKAEGIKRKDEE